MSQRFIVAFKEVRDVNNFNPLFPISEYRGVTFVFQRDPLITVTDNKINTNFDLLITTRHDPYIEQLLEDHQLVKIDRVPKEVQSLRLAKKAKELDLKNYLPNRVYYFQDLDLVVEALTEGKTYVVKPRMGARGLGMFLIDTKKIKLSSFLDVLSPLLFSNGENFPTNEKKSKYIETIVTHHDMNNGVEFFTGEESFDFESAEAITDWGIMIQEHIPNIIEEYRLVVSNGYIHSIRKRGIKDQNLRQAIPSGLIDAPIITREEFTTYLKSKGIEFKEVESLTQVAGDAPHSFDLFLTEDNQWGFFEYSNQFCIKDIPNELVREIHLSYLHKLLVPDFKAPETFMERINKTRIELIEQ